MAVSPLLYWLLRRLNRWLRGQHGHRLAASRGVHGGVLDELGEGPELREPYLATLAESGLDADAVQDPSPTRQSASEPGQSEESPDER